MKDVFEVCEKKKFNILNYKTINNYQVVLFSKVLESKKIKIGTIIACYLKDELTYCISYTLGYENEILDMETGATSLYSMLSDTIYLSATEPISVYEVRIKENIFNNSHKIVFKYLDREYTEKLDGNCNLLFDFLKINEQLKINIPNDDVSELMYIDLVNKNGTIIFSQKELVHKFMIEPIPFQRFDPILLLTIYLIKFKT